MLFEIALLMKTSLWTLSAVACIIKLVVTTKSLPYINLICKWKGRSDIAYY